MASVRASISLYIIVLAIQFTWSAPPPAPPGPGAPVGSALEVDAETKTFVEYIESCSKPGNQLCLAYQEIHGFYERLEPDSKPELLKSAFAAHHSTNISELCSALGEAGPVIKAIAVNGSESKFYRTFTDPVICRRRCGELNEDDQEIVRPICKLLTYELQQISKKKAETKPDVESKNETQSNVPAPEKPAETPAVQNSPVAVLPTVNSTLAQVQAPIQNSNTSSPSTSPTEEKKPASVTPGTNPQLAEDVQPVAPVAVSQKVSTSTVDYSNVIVPNNNEPDDNIKLSVDPKQSQQSPPAPGNEADGKVGGSLDDDQGGEMDDFNAANNEDDDGDYGMDEKPAESLDKPKGDASSIGGGDVPKEEEKLPLPVHNKKPTQVGDSFEVEGQLEELNRHHNKMSEMIDDPFYEEADSNFFAYFMFFMLVCVLGYVAYHNKNKVLGLLLEGRRGSMGRGGSSTGSRRSRGGSSRKHTAAYQKLDSNLEEAITSTGSSRSSQIIY